MVMVVEAPTASEFSVQGKTPPAQVNVGDETETKLTPAGSVSLNRNACDGCGPAKLSTVTVYVTLFPTSTGFGEAVMAVFVTLTSASPIRVTVAALGPLLLPGGSIKSAEATLALLETRLLAC